MCMVLPLNHYYPHMRAYHAIACALLLAAGICYFTGQYKFTLDIEVTQPVQNIYCCYPDVLQTVSGFYQYKIIVFIQFATIFVTRVLIFLPAGVDVLFVRMTVVWESLVTLSSLCRLLCSSGVLQG